MYDSRLYLVSATARAAADSRARSSGRSINARIASAKGPGSGGVSRENSGDSTCVCVSRLVATMGLPERRYE